MQTWSDQQAKVEQWSAWRRHRSHRSGRDVGHGWRGADSARALRQGDVPGTTARAGTRLWRVGVQEPSYRACQNLERREGELRSERAFLLLERKTVCARSAPGLNHKSIV